MGWDVKKENCPGTPIPPEPENTGERPPPSPRPPKKPPADPEAREAWIKALKAMQGMTPPVELPPEQRAWVAMYCAAISSGTHYREDAEEIADYGLVSLRTVEDRLKTI
jgi:hypothetical protein